jgi:hypothetical protein
MPKEKKEAPEKEIETEEAAEAEALNEKEKKAHKKLKGKTGPVMFTKQEMES